MRTTVPNPPVATHTPPDPAARSIAGAPMPIVVTTFRVFGSTRTTVPSFASPTQIAFAVAVTDVGREPTGMDATM